MTGINKDTEKWTRIGSSITSPTQQTNRKTIILDSPYVVVGFEVNNTKAFVDEKHDLAVDYGHAFFYLVEHNIITAAFSFGPDGLGKVGWLGKGDHILPNKYNRGAILKTGGTNSRPGTPDYPVTETVKAFRILISIEQATRLKIEISKIRLEIFQGKVNYNAFLNDTCAETAKEILDDAGIETPNGSGPIKDGNILPIPVVYAVNPYQWHGNFKKNGKAEKTFKPPGHGSWVILINQLDPIFMNPAK